MLVWTILMLFYYQVVVCLMASGNIPLLLWAHFLSSVCAAIHCHWAREHHENTRMELIKPLLGMLHRAACI